MKRAGWAPLGRMPTCTQVGGALSRAGGYCVGDPALPYEKGPASPQGLAQAQNNTLHI